MYVCGCRAVTDHTVVCVIAEGACTVDEIARRCGAGGRCGGCRPELEQLLSCRREPDHERDRTVAA
jgi:bacterioferritin-associated ferredoxin